MPLLLRQEYVIIDLFELENKRRSMEEATEWPICFAVESYRSVGHRVECGMCATIWISYDCFYAIQPNNTPAPSLIHILPPFPLQSLLLLGGSSDPICSTTVCVPIEANYAAIHGGFHARYGNLD